MATTATLGYNTIMDVVNQYSSTDGNAVLLEAAKVLHRSCPLIQMLPMEPGNQIMGHVGSKEAYLASPSPRTFNKGIVATESHNTPYNEGICMYEDYSEIDVTLCNIQKDPEGYRRKKLLQKVEGFKQALEYGLIYDSVATDGRKVNGLSTRFNSLSTYPNGDSTWEYNVHDGGGSTTLTSIYFLELGPGKMFGIYPPNLAAGLQIRDLGEQTISVGYDESTARAKMQVYMSHLQWFIGLVIEDDRCVQRVANVNSTVGGANGFDEELLIKAKNLLPGAGEDPGTIMLVNRRIKTQADIRAVSTKGNTYFTQSETGDVWGRPVTRFQGIPVLVCDKISNAESAVS